MKFRPEEQHRYNSPWNIAADFDVDMSFSPEDISGMLSEYEKDKSTGMNISAVAKLIFDYTSGYPFLVSRICKLIDETPLTWDEQGIEEAERKSSTSRTHCLNFYAPFRQAKRLIAKVNIHRIISINFVV